MIPPPSDTDPRQLGPPHSRLYGPKWPKPERPFLTLAFRAALIVIAALALRPFLMDAEVLR